MGGETEVEPDGLLLPLLLFGHRVANRRARDRERERERAYVLAAQMTGWRSDDEMGEERAITTTATAE